MAEDGEALEPFAFFHNTAVPPDADEIVWHGWSFGNWRTGETVEGDGPPPVDLLERLRELEHPSRSDRFFRSVAEMRRRARDAWQVVRHGAELWE